MADSDQTIDAKIVLSSDAAEPLLDKNRDDVRSPLVESEYESAEELDKETSKVNEDNVDEEVDRRRRRVTTDETDEGCTDEYEGGVEQLATFDTDENNATKTDAKDDADAKKLDFDEDRLNPQYIPKRGGFYEHDNRNLDEELQKEIEEKKGKLDAKKPFKSDGRWAHDRFTEDEQAPKSKEELIEIYGYDIRNEEAAPRARRRRRYGRGPVKYTRKWEDDEAYAKPAGFASKERVSSRGKAPFVGDRGGGDVQDFPRFSSAGRGRGRSIRGKPSYARGTSRMRQRDNNADYTTGTEDSENEIRKKPFSGPSYSSMARKTLQNDDDENWENELIDVSAKPIMDYNKNEYLEPKRIEPKQESFDDARSSEHYPPRRGRGGIRGRQRPFSRSDAPPPRFQKDRIEQDYSRKSDDYRQESRGVDEMSNNLDRLSLCQNGAGDDGERHGSREFSGFRDEESQRRTVRKEAKVLPTQHHDGGGGAQHRRQQAAIPPRLQEAALNRSKRYSAQRQRNAELNHNADLAFPDAAQYQQQPGFVSGHQPYYHDGQNVPYVANYSAGDGQGSHATPPQSVLSPGGPPSYQPYPGSPPYGELHYGIRPLLRPVISTSHAQGYTMNPLPPPPAAPIGYEPIAPPNIPAAVSACPPGYVSVPPPYPHGDTAPPPFSPHYSAPATQPPPVSVPAQEIYHGGMAYYSTVVQPPMRGAPPRRPKAAIPIVNPEEHDHKRHDSTGSIEMSGDMTLSHSRSDLETDDGHNSPSPIQSPSSLVLTGTN